MNGFAKSSHLGNGRCSILYEAWVANLLVRPREREGGLLAVLTTFLEGVYKLRCSSRPVTMVFIATLVP